MSEYYFDFVKFVGMEKSFAPDYQWERPMEFKSLVQHYMEYNFNRENPERYMLKMGYAVEYANKSILADKLNMDIDKVSSHEFQKSIVKLASEYDDLQVVGNQVLMTDGLRKSFQEYANDKNFLYEKIAKEAYETVE